MALAAQVLHVQLVLVNHNARLIANLNGSYPRRDRGAAVCLALSPRNARPPSLDACWCSFGVARLLQPSGTVPFPQIKNHHPRYLREIGHMLMLLRIKRFKIEDEGLVKDKLAAWACIRLDRLQPGYRFIDLKDAHGRPSAGKLLVNIEKKFR